MDGLDVVQIKGDANFKLRKNSFLIPKNHRLMSLSPEGSCPTNLISASGQYLTYRIQKGSVGMISHMFLMLTTTVASSAVQVTSSDFWFSLIQFFKDSSDYENSRITADSCREYLNLLTPSQLSKYMEFMNFSPNFVSNPVSLQVGTKSFIVPLPANYLKNIIMKNINHDIKIKFTSNNAVISGTAANLTISSGQNAQLIILYQDLPAFVLSDMNAKYIKGIDYSFLTPITQTFTQSFSASSTYNLQLTSMNGKCAYLFFNLRANPQTAAGFGTLIKIGDVVNQGSIQLLDSSNQNIYGNNVDAGLVDRLWESSQHLESPVPAFQDGTYRYNFSDPRKSWMQGSFDGYLPMKGDLSLSFVTASSTSETGRVITLTPRVTAGTATSPASGYWQLTYSYMHPVYGRQTFLSSPIIFSANAAAILAIIQAMGIPDITISNGATVLDSSTLVLTVTGITQSCIWHQAVYGAEFSVCANDLSSVTPALLQIEVVDTTASVAQAGFTAGTYTLTAIGMMWKQCTIKNGFIGDAIDVQDRKNYY